MNTSSHVRARAKGFTLIELIIVITILVILGIVVVVLIDPAEILAQSRDSQRISDLATVKGAIQLVLSNRAPTVTEFGFCPATATPNAGADIWASTVVAPAGSSYSVVSATSTRPLADGTGWIKLNFTGLGTGTALANLPVDPTNIATAGNGLYYRYSCNDASGRYEYEMDAAPESAKYKPSCPAANCDDKGYNDGGNSGTAPAGGTGLNNRYEVGNNLTVLPATAL